MKHNHSRLLALWFVTCLFPLGLGTVAGEVNVDWTHYHNHSETTELLESWAEEHKDVAKLYSVGKSFQGKDLWCLEITNYETGAPETKAGMYIDGNTHNGEVGGAQASLYIIEHLLTNYGKDALVTRLVDTKTFYIIPKINPDGSDAYLRDPRQPPEPGLKKVDDDGDGALDEDGPEDLNDDGIISLMRIRDDSGPLVTSLKDPRLMVERGIDEKGEWRIIGREGLDNDKDGEINEDPPGSRTTVTNRNYPAFWAPNWVQGGEQRGGPYPLSEPEARAQVDFILNHPNIAGIQSFHTHSGVLLRPYCNRVMSSSPPKIWRITLPWVNSARKWRTTRSSPFTMITPLTSRILVTEYSWTGPTITMAPSPSLLRFGKPRERQEYRSSTVGMRTWPWSGTTRNWVAPASSIGRNMSTPNSVMSKSEAGPPTFSAKTLPPSSPKKSGRRTFGSS